MLHLVLLLVFAAAQIALGLFIARRVKGASDFFVAGRQLGPGLLFSTFLAANIGAGSTVGAAGYGYRDGLSAWWWVGSAGIGSLFLAWWVGPKIRAIAAEHNLRTVGDFFEWRYDARVRATLTALLWVGALAILAGQLVALSKLVKAVLGWEGWIGCMIGGVVMTSVFGGRRLEIIRVGQHGAARGEDARLLHRTSDRPLPRRRPLRPARGHAARATTGTSFRAASPAGCTSRSSGRRSSCRPALLQKIYGARDDRAVRIGVGLNALGLLSYAIIPILLGMIARVLHPGLDRSRARAADAARARSAAARRIAGARGAVLGGSERGRRGVVHADDVAVAGPVSPLHRIRPRPISPC